MPVTQKDFNSVFERDPFDLVLELVFHPELPEEVFPIFNSTRRLIFQKTGGLQPRNKLDLPTLGFTDVRTSVIRSVRSKMGAAVLNLHHIICRTLEYCNQAARLTAWTISQIGRCIADQLVALGMPESIAILIAAISITIQSLDRFCNCLYPLDN